MAKPVMPSLRAFKAHYVLFRERALRSKLQNEREFDEQIAAYNHALRQAVRNLSRVQSELKAARFELEKNKEHADGEYAQLGKHAMLEKMETLGGIVTFTLKPLTLHWHEHGIEYPLAALRAILDLETGSLVIRVVDPDHEFWKHLPRDNEKNPRGIHPHVFANGRACLGNFSEVYNKILERGEYCQIVDLIVEFLETYNQNSPVGDMDFASFVARLEHKDRDDIIERYQLEDQLED